MTFEQWLAAKQYDTAKIPESLRAALKTAWELESGKTPEPAPKKVEAVAATATIDEPKIEEVVKERRKALAAEATRVAKVTALCAAAPTIKFKTEGAKDETATDLSAHAISEGWTEQQTELYILRASRPAPAIHSRSHENDCTLQALQGALLLRAGGQLDAKCYKTPQAVAMGLPRWLQVDINAETRQRIMEAAHRFATYSFIDFARESLRVAGRDVPTDRTQLIQAAFSGATLTNVFTTSVNATLLAAYMSFGDTSQLWTSSVDVNNYLTQERTQVDKGGALNKLPRGATADDYTLSDRQETYKIAAYGRKFIVDEQDIIDDRLDAIRRAPIEMGEAAARLRPDLVYALLMRNATLGVDSVALFHADHSNLNTTATLTHATLKTALSALEKQRRNSVNLGLKATHLCVPPDLKFFAKEIANSATLLYGADDETVRGSRNTIADENLFVFSEPRLANGVDDPVDGANQAGSTTTWYLFDGRPSTPGIEVAYLSGTGRAPQVRSGVLSEGKWGMWWDVKHSIGAKALDFLFGQKNTA